MSTNLKTGFTLAEVLITLGVIGVVSAMTMPTLIQKHKEQRTIAQLQKVYSTLSQAWQRMEAEYGSIDTWGMENTDTLKQDTEGNTVYDFSGMKTVSERFQKYLKVTKKCQIGEVCYPYAVYNMNGVLRSEANKPVSNEGAAQSFYLSDGTFVSMGWYNKSTNSMDIRVILSGNNKAVYGKNAFYFTGYPYKLLPSGTTSDEFNAACKHSGTNLNVGRSCTAWVLYNKNMDYLHCDDLSLTGKSKCK